MILPLALVLVLAAEVVKTTPAELIGAYLENEIAADRRFKGKTLAVEGIVQAVGRTNLGNAYVTLGGPHGWRLQCQPDPADGLGALKRNKIVTLEGTFDGLYRPDKTAMLQPCRLAK